MIGEVESLHRPFIAFLRKVGLPYIYARSDKKSGIAEGHPDFTVLRGNRVAMIEFKVRGAKLSDVQLSRQLELLAAENTAMLTTMSLEEAIRYTEAVLYGNAGIEPVAAQDAPSQPEPKFWRANIKHVGIRVVTRDKWGNLVALRAVTAIDEQLPMLPGEF